ncbi:hypothetical protein [Ruminococcus sp.]|uniref:hypothetical protein n=1 Tax=Ruminococcus sp. TaxID=41978 RepID=UPI00388D4333
MDNNGNVEYFTDAWKAWDKAEQNNGTFGLMRDWVYNRRRNVRGTQVMTVELNGHYMSRGRGKNSWENDGEVICVGEGGTLNVYGGTKEEPSLGCDTTHSLYGYTHGNETFDYTTLTFKGGVIHGGNSSNGGGGIQMKAKSKVNLYYTTIAGNRAEQTGGSDGYGGGVYMGGTNCKLYMDHSTISYNYAYNDGGGVYVNNARCSIKMVKSHIDHNISDDNGGGIYADDEYFRLEGDAKQVMDPESISNWSDESVGSTVSNNYIVDSDAIYGGGGGLYLDNDKCVVTGINFVGNDADDDGDGGGIMVDNDKNTIENCTIYHNQARDTGGAGGGIYVDNDVNVNIEGSTIIRSNGSKDYSADNLYLAGFGSLDTNALINPVLAPGADVHVRLSSHHKDRISVKGTFNETYFTYDNDNGKHINWSSAERYLTITSGAKPVKTVETFVPDSGKRTQSITGGYTVGGTNYELLKGVFEYPAFDNPSADLENVFYYSDGYFMGDTNQYNEHLATMSFALAGAAGYSNIGGTKSDDSYLDKSNNFRQLMSDIGCKDENIYVNDFNVIKPSSGSIGVGLATKKLQNGDDLVVIGVRGMGYESEWVSNMTLGTSGEAQGWSIAAGQVFGELGQFLDRKGIDPKSERTKFWIAGYSRAGATSNLTAKRIVDNYDKNGTHTFAYPLEAPKGGVSSAKVSGNNYNCIHNIVNQNDIVTWVGPGEMGLIRYGVDHYVPGSVTTNASNSAWNVAKPSDSTSDYGKQREKLRKQLSAVNSGIVFDDYFHKGDLDFFDSVFGMDLVDETVLDDWTTEYFIKEFFKYFCEYAFGTDNPRNGFAGEKVANGKTFQEAAATVANLLMGKSAEESAGIAGCFASLMDRLGTGEMIKLYEAIRKENIGIGTFVSPPMTVEMIVHMVDGSEYWETSKKTIWKYLTELSEDDVAKGYHKLSEYMTEDELKALESCFSALMDPIYNVLVSDYAHEGQNYIGTLAYNVSRIIANHYPEVTNAWLRSYDSFYQNDTNAVTMDSACKTAPSSVAVKIKSADGSERIVTDFSGYINVGQDELVSLVPSAASDRDTGEAIYYHFTSGKKAAQTLHAFSRAWDLNKMAGDYTTDDIFTVKVVAAHNDQRAAEQTIRFILSGTALYQIPVSYDGSQRIYNYSENALSPNEEITISGIKPTWHGECIFKEWKIYPIVNGQAGTTPVEPKDYVRLFGEQFRANESPATVKNLTGGSFRFTPSYDVEINMISVNCIKLMQSVTCSVGNDILGSDIPVRWDSHSQNVWSGKFDLTLPDDYKLSEYGSVSFLNYPSNVEDVDFKELSANGNILTVTFDVRLKSADESDFITVDCKDINTQDNFDTVYYCKTGLTTTITAPIYPDMEFVRWLDVNPAIGSVTDATITVYTTPAVGDMDDFHYGAEYRPIVKSVKATLDKPLVGGEEMPSLKELTATITNDWSIDNARLEWIGGDTVAKYSTVYTARFSVDKSHMTGRIISEQGSESEELTGKVAFAEDINAEILDADGNKLDVTSIWFSQDSEGIYLDVVFEKTNTAKITGYEPVTACVPYGSDEAAILAALPESVTAYIAEGTGASIPVSWNSVSEIKTTIDPQTVTASGSFVTDEYDTSGVTLSATVTIYGDKRLADVQATPPSGNYTGVQKIELTQAEGAKIKYVIIKTEKDAEYPSTKHLLESDFTEYTDPIIVNDYSKITYIFTGATKVGENPSHLIGYAYDLTKPEVTKLDATPEKIAEYGNKECWYSTKTVKEYNPETGEEITSTAVPDRYYSDESCTKLLDYKTEVLTPPFIKASHETFPRKDINLLDLGYSGEEDITYSGFEKLGVQGITDSNDVRVLTVADSRVLRDATDYGWIFDISSEDESGEALTVDTAKYKYSCKNSVNDMKYGYGNTDFRWTDYKYVTARVNLDDKKDKTVRARFYVCLENGVDYIYTAESVCTDTPTIESSAAMDSVSDNVTFDAARAELFVAHSISLNGNIGINYYLNDNIVTDELVSSGKVKVDFAWMVEGKQKTHSVIVSPDDKKSVGYVASCPVAAAEMTYDVTAAVTIDGAVQDETNTYSVKQYADIILSEKFESSYNGDKPYADLKSLIQAMLDYGARSQLRFNRNTDQPANGGVYTFTDPVKTSDIPLNISDLNFELDAYGLEYTGSTAVLLTETSLRHYYKIINQERFNYYKDNATFNGNKVGYTVKGDEIYFELKNISAADLDTRYEIYFGYQKNYYSVMDYVRNYLEKNSGESNNLTRDVVMAMYYYNQKANVYFE